MSGKKAISAESGGNALLLPISVSVLLVDGDSTCLAILLKMLYWFGYKVNTAKQATDALCIAREREGELNLMLAEAHLPDMDKYELLETVGEISKLPIVIMSADDNENDMLGGLFKGAAFYLVKPLSMNDIKNLWQFAFIKKTDKMVTAERLSGFSSDGMDDQMLPNKGKRSDQDAKRKEEMDKNEQEDNDDYSVQKKPKLIWTHELHNRFLQAIGVLGIDGAHPKKILQYMNVPGLKKENISSHLQKYRLSLKREQDTVETTLNRDYNESHVLLCNLSSTVNVLGSLFQFPEMQSMTTSCQPESRRQEQKNENSCMSMYSLGSAHVPNHVGPSYNDILDCRHGQLAPTRNQEPARQLAPTCSGYAGIRINNNRKLVGFHQMLDFNGEEFVEENMASSNNVDSGLEGAVQWPSSLTQQEEEKGQQQQHQHLFVPKPSTQDHGEHDINCAERVGIDEFFDTTKVSTQLFIDENFHDLW